MRDDLVRIARDADHLALLRELRPVSHLRVPLVARGRVAVVEAAEREQVPKFRLSNP